MRRQLYWLQLHQGTEEEPPARTADGDEVYPYWYRLVALPLFLLGLPFLFVWWWLTEIRKEPLRVQVLVAGLMIFLYLASPYLILHPRGMSDARVERMSQLVQATKDAVAQRRAIARLVERKEA